MRCPKCTSGVLHTVPVRSSAGQQVVCDNTDCFIWFNVQGNTIEVSKPVTSRMQERFADVEVRCQIVEGYPIYQ